MNYKSLFRMLMIAVGIVASAVIVLSQALPEMSSEVCRKAKTEQTEDTSTAPTFVAPSADVVPGGSMQISDVDRALLVTLEQEEKELPAAECISMAVSEYMHVLLRTIISPNAP